MTIRLLFLILIISLFGQTGLVKANGMTEKEVAVETLLSGAVSSDPLMSTSISDSNIILRLFGTLADLMIEVISLVYPFLQIFVLTIIVLGVVIATYELSVSLIFRNTISSIDGEASRKDFKTFIMMGFWTSISVLLLYMNPFVLSNLLVEPLLMISNLFTRVIWSSTDLVLFISDCSISSNTETSILSSNIACLSDQILSPIISMLDFSWWLIGTYFLSSSIGISFVGFFLFIILSFLLLRLTVTLSKIIFSLLLGIMFLPLTFLDLAFSNLEKGEGSFSKSKMYILPKILDMIKTKNYSSVISNWVNTTIYIVLLSLNVVMMLILVKAGLNIGGNGYIITELIDRNSILYIDGILNEEVKNGFSDKFFGASQHWTMLLFGPLLSLFLYFKIEKMFNESGDNIELDNSIVQLDKNLSSYKNKQLSKLLGKDWQNRSNIHNITVGSIKSFKGVSRFSRASASFIKKKVKK
ncbi:MAG: hypothetical protein JJV93_02250 [Alphaproteobacteria bacterium]|nr:hypothetical protein [Alphaproteobacteria bacterium]